MNIKKDNSGIEPEVVVFTDFDGTITKLDIGDELFKDLGEFEPYHSLLINGEMNIRDYWIKLCGKLEPGVDIEAIKQYIKGVETDSYFSKFAEYCRTNGIPVGVISDGFDSYIKPLMERESLEWIDIYSNKMLFEPDGIKPFYPMASESCECLCASCKRNTILNNAPPEAIIVYIGDGYSDYCAAKHSDVIFAKKELAAYCNVNKLPHYPYSNFFDVYRIFNNIYSQKKMKKRHQAQLLRNKAFETE